MFDETPAECVSLMQTPAFAQALKLCGQTPLTLSSGEMLLIRRFLGLRVAMLPRSAPPEDLEAQLHTLGLRRTPVILSPDVPCALPRAVPIRRARDQIVLKLAGGNDLARARLHSKWRNQLARVEKRPVHVTYGPLDPDPRHPLLVLEQAQCAERRYQNWPAALTAAFAAAAPRQTHLFSAEYRDKTVAHMLFLSHGSRATYHIGHITPLGRKLYAHNLLLWRASRLLATLGHQTLDLGLMQHGATGLNRFKLRTGAERHPTGGTWLYWRPLAKHPPRQSSP